jgi:aldehyde dehydrogenase (NAD+)
MESFHQIYVGGSFVDTYDGKTYDNINPATEESLGQAPDAGLSDTKRAIEAARASFDSGIWSDAPLEERARVMRHIAHGFEKAHQDMVDITVAEVGHPVRICEGMAQGATVNAHYLAELAGRDFGYVAEPILGDMKTTHRLVLREPVGVVSAILPYNAPIQVASYKALAAIAAGNSVVMKPSPLTPYSALLFAKIVADSDLPPGVLNVITATGVDSGVELSESPRVDMVSFTGSPEVGAAIMTACGKTLKRVMLELGGKSAYIVLDDAPVPLAAALACATPMGLSGQGCSLPTRVLMPRSMGDEFLEIAKKTLESLKIGDPTDPNTILGPVVSKAQRARVERYVGIATDEGATLLTGGKRPADLPVGYFYEPTLFHSVTNDMRIAQEEVFGPVAVIIPYDDIDDAIRICNDSIFGLGGNILSTNPERSMAVAKRMRTGQVWINTPLTDAEHCLPYPDIPFGGYKHSGVGREMGIEGYLEYTEIKNIASTF